MSLIKSVADAGSVRSMGEKPSASKGAPNATEGVVSSTIVVGDLVDLATATHDLNDVSLPSMGELLGDVVGVGNLDVDNVDQTFAPLSADVPNTSSLSGEAESPHPEEGVTAGVTEPGAGGFDGHSSVGQHVPGNAFSTPRSRVRR
ncbi:hypothetical protein ACLOJK_027267, partial [Asimina triloba]